MLAKLKGTSSRTSWTLRGLIVVGALAALTLPAVYLSTTSGVLAQDANGQKQRAAATAEPATEFLPPLSPAEEKILAALEQPTLMEFAETPLHDAVAWLQDYHSYQIPMRIDKRALEGEGLSDETPLSLHLQDVSLKSALRLLLHEKHLTYIIRDEVLLITTPDVAEMELFTRTYPVGDLIDAEDGKTLIETITSTVVPMSWAEAGGPASIIYVPSAMSLVISQTRDRHDEVLELLRSLRAARKLSAAGK